jgi:putative endonuclease
MQCVSGRRELGEHGERSAERALVARGLTVVARNARTRYGEIDLVCREPGGYVFVEVKARQPGSFVAPVEAADARKLRRLARLAAGWLAGRGERGVRWRMALAAVTLRAEGAVVDVIDV